MKSDQYTTPLPCRWRWSPSTRQPRLLYGPVRAALERQGTPIGALDLLIAAHALSQGVILVTNNPREFSRVPGLRVENWV